MALYDTIGVDYRRLRHPDPRIARLIDDALGRARTVLNVGAGTGSYEPEGRLVTAVEPSAEMIRQRPSGKRSAVVQANAEALPFADNMFDAVMAVLSVHHWTDQVKGLKEMRRVARGPVVLLTYDPDHRPWLTDYLPELVELDSRQMPPIAFYAEHLGKVSVTPIPVPHDCTDGFLYAFWRRPRVYLDARYRSGSSSFWALGDTINPGLARLEADMGSGEWHRRYGHLAGLETLDVGYRLIVAT
ncbi:MAG: class I SAM-dependent methyltransferase [Novosphingobium sp.]|uniref:class I SAM-dependent methyltransferase n=1 Tax=Novosphingobium sp. TaxID=1874826 RepID=UPI003B9C774C